VLLDAEKVYDWAVGKVDYEDDSGNLEELEDAPEVEVRGELPRYLPRRPFRR